MQIHPYAELDCVTNFTFLTGASHPDELVRRAAELGHRGLAVTDRHSLAGVVRAHAAAKEAGLPFAVGCRLVLSVAAPGDDAPRLEVLVYPTDRAAYGRLCALLTVGKRRTTKGNCDLALSDLIDHQAGLLAVLVPPAGPYEAPFNERQINACEALADAFDDDRLSVATAFRYGPDDATQAALHALLARRLGVPLAATNRVHYHDPVRKPLHDVLCCIRHGCTLDRAGRRLDPNAERHLKAPAEMHRMFRNHPGACARAAEVLARAAAFSLDQLKYEYPHETCPPGRTADEHLRDLTEAGARERYPGGVPDHVRKLIEHELKLIAELNYPHYFLTVQDIVAFARRRGILCQGRGAAANSAVCYCLGVTAVDPTRIDLLFERFISKERDEPPDIDLDFEHERREEVMQYLYARYGRHRAALTAEVVTYRARSAVREVGKALGLSADLVDRLAKDRCWFEKEPDTAAERYRALGVDPDAPVIRRLRVLTRQILGFPRHLSQHVGGFVLTQRPLSETVPIENAAMAERTVIEWDKDDLDALGMLKIDLLALGMLTAVRKTLDLVAQHHGRRLAFHEVPPEDPATYAMISKADTVGVFQIESRAQMTMLPRLKPATFYDLVIEVAIVRPGPIQGGMVHPYLRRRNKEEDVDYPSPDVERVLKKTLGVPLFQEQAMQLAIVAAGFTPGEADGLRRAMAAWKRKGNLIYRYGARIIDGMRERGYEKEFAERCFEQIKGFSEYGFPESHAASFALIVYVSAWLKCHYPAAFTCSLLNSQPMGFYAPAQLVRDAQEHGIAVRPVDVNFSAWDCTLEPAERNARPALRPGGAGFQSALKDPPEADPSRCPPSDLQSLTEGRLEARPAIRLGLRRVKGLQQVHAQAVARAAALLGSPDRGFTSVEHLWRASGIPVGAVRALASADAFTSLGLDRQGARWQAQKLRDTPLPLFDAPQVRVIPPAAFSGNLKSEIKNLKSPFLPPVPAAVQVAQDYGATGLSLKAHPVSFLRKKLAAMRVRPNADLHDEKACPRHRRVRVAGLVLMRQRPGTASGVMFVTLEDETGIANLIVRPAIFERDRRAALHEPLVIADGRVERKGPVVHVLVSRLRGVPAPAGVAVRSRDFH